MSLKRKVVTGSAHGNHQHGLCDSSLYRSWVGMKQRCGNPKNPRYANYGGRGIRVCDEWKRFAAFRDWAKKEGYIDGLSIERRDVNGNYEPDNCTWIPMNDQSKNATSNRKLTFEGKTMNLTDWAKERGMKVGTLWYRVKSGWSTERALSENLASDRGRFVKGHKAYVTSRN